MTTPSDFTNYELRREDSNQARSVFCSPIQGRTRISSQLALISNVVRRPASVQASDKEAVNLSTVHQAKGLDFPRCS